MASSPDRWADEPDDLDAQWADLTARLGPLETGPDLDTGRHTPGPGDEARARPIDPDEVTPGDLAGARDGPGNTGPRDYGPRDYGPRDYAVDGPEEGFVPPEPGPIITGASRNNVPWIAAAGGPILLLLMLIFWPSAPAVAYLLTVAATIAGLLVLWWRLPQRRDDDDDGAVV